MNFNTGAIILAAGNSSRMGKCKFLLPMPDGITFLENILYAFTDFGVGKIVIVTQKNSLKAVHEICKDFAIQPLCLVNDYPEKERFYSLQMGIKVMQDINWCFIHNADAPFIDPQLLRMLHDHREDAPCICPVYENKGGHPILVNRNTLRYLLQWGSETNLKQALHSIQRAFVPVSNSLITADIDTRDDYNKYIPYRLW